MPKMVIRNYAIEEQIFKQFSVACAKLNITKTEGVNEALKLFVEKVLLEGKTEVNK